MFLSNREEHMALAVAFSTAECNLMLPRWTLFI